METATTTADLPILSATQPSLTTATKSLFKPPHDHPFLGQTLRIKVSDNRVIQGVLESADKDVNVVLSESYDVTEESKHIYLSVVVIPGKHVVSLSRLVQMDPAPSPR